MFVQSPLLRSSGVLHGFTGDRWDLLKPGAFAEVAAALGAPDSSVARVRQVHGNVCVDGDAGGSLDLDADAVIVARSGVIASVRVADCVPILLAAPGAVAAVHAGWRGTVARIAPIALQHLCVRARCRPQQVVAAIGPCISVEHYEVGDEVLDAVNALGPGLTRDRHADLKAANAHLLREAGVEALDVLEHCTIGTPGFFSYRRDPGCGRQGAFIQATETG